MRNRNRKLTIGWFLFGLGSQLQLWGVSLSFTELFIYMATPVLISGEIPYMRRNGLMALFWLAVAVIVGAAISCVANHSPMYAVVRGMATVCLLPCTIVVCHWMLRTNMQGFRWWLVGAALSGILCTFVFQRSVEVAKLAGGLADKHAAQAIMSGPIYWIGRLGPLLNAPAAGWYLQCPTLYCIGVPLFMVVFSMMTSASGRSAALCALGAAALVILGGKNPRSMRRIGRYFWFMVLLAIFVLFAAKNLYSYAAMNNWLGDDVRQKYEGQTKGNSSMWALLVGGRVESFAGFLACFDKPIFGFGPWAMDTKGYVREFIHRYGTSESKDELVRVEQLVMMAGQQFEDGLLPAHSHITMFWISYGIFGLIFWIYVIYVLIRYIRQDCWVIPQWYMWLGAGTPGILWNIFFSPYSNRVGMIMFVVACLMVRAVRKGRQRLPAEMIVEIMNSERGGRIK